MGYGNKSLNDLRDEAYKIATEHGFKDASIGEDFALMHSEISEALEDYRDGRNVREIWYEEKLPDGSISSKEESYNTKTNKWRKPCGIPSEMADVIIRILHFCGKHRIDIEQAVREKMQYNDSRPFKHDKIL